MEAWRKVFREGIAPQLSTPGLEALLEALKANDARLLQGQTVDPVPLTCNDLEKCEAACLVAYAGWIGDGLATVGDVDRFVERVANEADQRIGEERAIRYVMNFWDDAPRSTVLAAFIPEVEACLAERRQREQSPAGSVEGDCKDANTPAA